jgi:hypothetical protein
MFKNAAGHIYSQQQKQKFKPFGIVYFRFGRNGTKIIFNKCCKPDGVANPMAMAKRISNIPVNSIEKSIFFILRID